MKFQDKLWLGMVCIPLLALFLVGISCSYIAHFFDWVDCKCRDWFQEIYGK